MTLESRNKEKIWKDKPIGFESDDTSAWVTSTEALHATIDFARDLGCQGIPFPDGGRGSNRGWAAEPSETQTPGTEPPVTGDNRHGFTEHDAVALDL